MGPTPFLLLQDTCTKSEEKLYQVTRNVGLEPAGYIIVTYSLKARKVEPEKQPLLGNARTQQ
jgi:hypothetical protein